MLIRASDSEVGSSAATIAIDPRARTVTGSVTSGNFCGYIDRIDQRSYYTLYFVAAFDRPFAAFGTWTDGAVSPGSRAADGGTTYGADGYPAAGRGSGGWVTFDTQAGSVVNVHVGVLVRQPRERRGQPAGGGPAGDGVRRRAQPGGAGLEPGPGAGRRSPAARDDEQVMFYTALYHALLHPNVFSDVNGQYRGFDRQVHAVASGQHAQYANFSGWDVYRSQLPLVTLLEPAVGSDIAQSLLNQADQNGGAWDCWTHNTGATHVMEGDPSPAAVAGIYAFGGTHFDAKAALASSDQGGDRADGGRSQRGRLPGGVRRPAAVARSLAAPALHPDEGAGVGRRRRDTRGRVGRFRDRAARRQTR